MVTPPHLAAIELSKQEIEVLIADHLHHGDENLKFAKLVEEEGIEADDLRRLAVLRFKRASNLMGIAHSMVHSKNVPA